MNKVNTKNRAINIYIFAGLILLELLYLLNRDFLRPSFRTNETLVILLGSLPNFLAGLAAGIATIPISIRWFSANTSRVLVYSFSTICLGMLILEEISPFIFGSKVNDVNDIIASIAGSMFALIIHESITKALFSNTTIAKNTKQ